MIREIVRSVAMTLAAILMASAICFAEAQIQRSLDPDYIRTDFTVEDGLPDNVINATVETENGLLWLGTESGLATFDGRDFNPIRLHIPGAPSQGAVNTLLESSNGDLWVGTDAGLVLIPKSALDELDPARMTFYPLGATRSDEVEALLETRSGVLWVGTTHGLYRREGANFVNTIQNVSINCLNEGAKGGLLITTSKGFVEFDGAKMIEHPGFAGRFGLHDDQINDVFRDRGGVLWFSTQAGIRRQASHRMPAMRPHQVFMTQAVRTYEDRQGNLWVTTGVGAYRVTGDQLESPDSRVNARCLSVSRDGTVWMGTNGNGLVRLRRRIVHMFTKADGMQEDIAMAVLPSDDGKLWIGNNCGFAEFDGRRFKTYNEKDGLLNTCVWSLAEDRQKTLWIGTYGGGIFSFRNGHFTQYSKKEGLASTIVFQITIARDGSLWIATPDGVSHMEGGKFRNYSTADGLSSNRILSLHEDKHGTIWAETQAGLDRLGPHGFSPFGSVQFATDQLATRFAEDRSGGLYTTNSPKGISRIDEGRIAVVNQTLSVMDMVEADDHYLWLSSRNGIFRIRRDDLMGATDQDTPLDYEQIDRNDVYTEAQRRGWQGVTDAVHRAGGHMIVQLWHQGSVSNRELVDNGRLPFAPSATDPEQLVHTGYGKTEMTSVPAEMTLQDIKEAAADFRHASQVARDAGFDGVQIQGGFVYLFQQFLQDNLNLRTDAYGGTIANRARLLFEVLEAVLEVWPSQRVGIKAGPMMPERGGFRSLPSTLATSEYVYHRLNDYNLSHVMLMRQLADLTGTPIQALEGDGVLHHFRKLYSGTLMLNAGIDAVHGEELLQQGLGELVAFGREYIANPDLVERIRLNSPLNAQRPEGYYGSTGEGYTDFPTLAQVESAKEEVTLV